MTNNFFYNVNNLFSDEKINFLKKKKKHDVIGRYRIKYGSSRGGLDRWGVCQIQGDAIQRLVD